MRKPVLLCAVIIVVSLSAAFVAGCASKSDKLIQAAFHGDLAAVSTLLEEGADIEARDSRGRTPLIAAAIEGHSGVVRFLVERDADIEARNSAGQTALLAAAGRGHGDVVRFLVEQGADVNARTYADAAPTTEPETTALIQMAWRRDADTVIVLLEAGADVNARSGWGRSALFEAVDSGNLQMVEILLAHGADPNLDQLRLILAVVGDDEGAARLNEYSLLMYAASHERKDHTPERFEIFRALLAAGADPLFKTRFGDTPLSVALTYGHDDISTVISQAGAQEEDIYVGLGPTEMLLKASGVGDVDRVRELLEAGPDYIEDAFKEAVLHGHAPVVSLLLDYGVEINVQNQQMRELFLEAAFKCYTDVVRLFLDSGMPPDVTKGATPSDEFEKYLKMMGENTPLVRAAQAGCADTVLLLLEAGADPDIRGFESKAALYWAAEYGHADAAQVLLEHGANINLPEGLHGEAPLLIAALRGHIEVVEVLLAHGADVRAKDDRGRTAIQLAESSGHTEIVELLREAGADE